MDCALHNTCQNSDTWNYRAHDPGVENLTHPDSHYIIGVEILTHWFIDQDRQHYQEQLKVTEVTK